MKNYKMAEHEGYPRNWNEDKGFGFVSVGIRNDAFIHVSELNNGLKSLKDSIWISFDIEQSSKGLRAVNVTDLSVRKAEEKRLEKIEDDKREKQWLVDCEVAKKEFEALYKESIKIEVDTNSIEDLKDYMEKSRDNIQKLQEICYIDEEEWNFNHRDKIEKLEEDQEEKNNILINLKRELEIKLGNEATELYCRQCKKTKLKAEFDKSDHSVLRGGYVNTCRACLLENEEIALAKEKYLNQQIENTNFDNIKKTKFKELVRLILKNVNNRNYRVNVSDIDGKSGDIIRVILNGGSVTNYWSTGRDSFGDEWITSGRAFVRGHRISNKGNNFWYTSAVSILGNIDTNFETIIEILKEKYK